MHKFYLLACPGNNKNVGFLMMILFDFLPIFIYFYIILAKLHCRTLKFEFAKTALFWTNFFIIYLCVYSQMLLTYVLVQFF